MTRPARMKIPRMAKVWTDMSESSGSITGGNTWAVDAMPNVDNPMELTIMRIIGDVYVGTTAVETASTYNGVGLIVASNFDSPPAIPFDGLMHDWMYMGSFGLGASEQRTVDTWNSGYGHIHFDVKGRRRLQEGANTLWLIVFNAAGLTKSYWCQIRILLAGAQGAGDIG